MRFSHPFLFLCFAKITLTGYITIYELAFECISSYRVGRLLFPPSVGIIHNFPLLILTVPGKKKLLI